MKKLLVVLLTLILCVASLSSCDFLKNFAEIRGEGNNQGTNEEFNVDAAAEYIYNLYKNKSVTATDFEVTAVASIAGVRHTVEWSVDTDKVSIKVKDANTFIVDVDEESPEELAYVLTATVKGGDKTATKSFNLTVPKYVLTPFEEYIDMTEGNVVVKGIVVGINSKAAGNTRNHLFLADLNGKGGYYSYQMDADPVADLGIEVGMIVEVSGPVSPYSGMQEIKGGVARIVDPTIHEFEIVDITEAFANGSSLKNYVGMLVTIKGVEITGQELGGTSDYLKFKLNGKEAYVRTYVTDFPTSLKADDKATIDAAHLEHFGWNANATGILVLYNSNPYLIPVGVDCFEYLQLIVKTDEEKIADVLDQLKLGTSYTSDAVVDLPTAVYPEVVLTWTSNNTDLVAIADGKLTVTVPDAATEVIVTVTATCGDATSTKEFTLKLSKTAESVKDIIDLGASMNHNQYTAEKHLVAGIISEVYNTQYGNMKIVDELGNVLTIYGTYSADGSARYDAMENAPVAGDYVVIFGIVGQYNGTPQIKNGWIMSVTKPTSVKDAIDTGASMDHNTYTEGKVVVTGVITEVYNTTYGNMKITDENGNILTIYGTYSSTGADRYDAMSVQPVAGDTVTIYGILGQYSGTPQIKNGWIVARTAGSETPECKEHVDADGDKKCDVCGADMPNDNPPDVDTPAPDSTLSVKDAIDFALTQEHNVFTEGKYYVTGVIKEVYNDMYGNMRIVDEAGNVLTLYGTYNADGSVRYDALEVKPVAGDTITVYGVIGQYNGTPQVKNGWIVKHTPAGETPEIPECKEHVDADGDEKCDVCGADVPKVDEPKDPAADSTLSIEEVIALGASKEHNTYTEGKYYVTGVITEVYNTQYGNMKITDEAGNILTIYGTYSADGSARYDAMEVKPVAGDTVTIYGIVGQYNGTPQIKNGWIVKHTPVETPDTPDAPANDSFNITAAGGTLAEDSLSISWSAETFDIVVYKDKSQTAIRVTDADHFRCYAGTKFTLTGKTENAIAQLVFTVTDTKYAQILVDSATAAGYTASANGKTVTIVVGATSVEFSLSAQARFNTIEAVYGEAETPDTPDEPEVKDPAADSTLTVEEVITLGASKEHNVYTEGKYYVTGVITEVYNTTYGNMKITDDKGNVLTIYGTYSKDGSARYDAMEVKPVAGDTVTIYGIVGQYNGTPQIKNGWIVDHVAAEKPEEPETPDTPAQGNTKTYTFANYEAGVQYAENEVHVLDEMVTVTTNESHFTKQLRLYQNAANNYGPARNGTAVFQLASAVKSLSINAGEKANPVTVYGSTDGVNWVLITVVEATSTYTDYEITLNSTEYTYIKLAATDGQARVASITFGF